jgi:predicted NAD-dependent protein-ADP-ribosyltransferase YbiA (DUF1768 family)
MHISYLRVVRDDSGEVIDTLNADHEIRWLNKKIAILSEALETEIQQLADLRELLDQARRLAVEAHKEIVGRD